MPANPSHPPATSPVQRIADRLANIERRLRNLEGQVQGGATPQIPVVDTLPAAGRKGRLVYLTTDGKVYKDTGSTWANPL